MEKRELFYTIGGNVNWCMENSIERLLSRVQLFVTPWTVTHQAPLSMEFSRQEYWNGLPFLFPGDLPDPVIKPRSPSIAGRVFPFWGAFLMKWKIELIIWSSSPTPGHMSKKKKMKTLILKDTCTPIFIAALFTIAKLSIKVLLTLT